jgi:monoamine oxidase
MPAQAAPRRRAARTRRTGRRADVIVVGAGFAGLAAAREIVRAGRTAIVLDARDRVGGRVLNHPIGDGHVVEVGGQWVGPTQDRMLALAHELGVETFKTYNEGQNVYLRRAGLVQRQRYSTGGPLGPVPPELPGAAEAGAAIALLNDLAAQVPPEAPWRAPQARELDGQTFETWKNAHAATDGGRFLLDVGIEAVFAAEPRDVSLLFVLMYIAAARNGATAPDFNRLLNTAGGAQESRFVGGSELVALRMAQALGSSRLVLGAPVRRIVQRHGEVRVDADGTTVRAHRAIVAMAPTLAGRIAYEPALPALRDQLTQRYPMGNVIKCQAIYDRPFWRDDGLTGQAVGDADPVRVTFDNSPPDGGPGVLLGFIEGELARQWGRRPPDERRAAVLESFAAYFGAPARQARDYVERDWSGDPWSRGCYVGFTGPGVLLDYGEELRRPVDRVHWAGTETATMWNGYMEGAVESGRRAAEEALAALPATVRRG